MICANVKCPIKNTALIRKEIDKMCDCIKNIIKNLKQKGYEQVARPVEPLSGKLYLQFTGRKEGQFEDEKIAVLIPKCPFCGQDYQEGEDYQE